MYCIIVVFKGLQLNTKMGLRNRLPWSILQLWVLLFLSLRVNCDTSDIAVHLLRTPHALSNKNSARFLFEIVVNGKSCKDCTTNCKLDNHKPSACENRRAYYSELQDGNHTFEVCTDGFPTVACAGYNWSVDTVPPTAYVTAPTSFTNASNVPVNISFSEPCGGGDGFQCSTSACNLLVYGAGEVLPNTFKVIQPNMKFSLTVSLSTNIQYGRAILVVDKNFCTDSAGNKLIRTGNSTFFLHFDRRNVFANIRAHIPEKLLQINRETRTVLATNKAKNLKIYLYFTEPVLNSSAEIMNSINISQGSILPIGSDNVGNRRFGFQVKDTSDMAIVTVSLDSSLVISRQGTPISPVAPVTFLYDSARPAVWLSTTSSTRTSDKSIPVLIKFLKPVFGFNSSHITLSGGHLESFHEMTRSIFTINVRADGEVISINIPENVTDDVSGNRNLASNTLQVRHYSVPMISLALSSFTSAAFAVTSLAAGLLTVSTASLLSFGAIQRPSSLLTSDPARNLFRMGYHIQVFALSRWLAVTLPIEYYEFVRGLQWSIPYFNLPWETAQSQPVMEGLNSPANPQLFSSKIDDSRIFETVTTEEQNSSRAAAVYGLPLTPMEYKTFFEGQNIMPEAQHILDPQNTHGWRDFKRSMFWLALIYGSLVLLHTLLSVILILRKKSTEKYRGYGALVFPRLEIFLLILAIPCVCQASAALVTGGESSGIVIGALIQGVVFFLLLALLLFLSIGITLGKLLQYKEVHRVDQKFHWYQELIRVTLGPGKRGQWTWKNQPNSIYLTMLGPLFEDLRGPPKYMLSQIAGGTSNKRVDRIIASDDETEDAEAPFIQKLFGILRIYYTLLEAVKRVSLGIVAGACSENWSSRTPTVILFCITFFQLFFMVLKKPFIKKRLQLVQIISVFCEVGIFASCIVLLERDFSARDEWKLGIFMISLFFLAFLVQLTNEWYALYMQTKRLDPAGNLFSGLKNASVGFLLFFIPHGWIKNLEDRFPLNNNADGDTGNNTATSDSRDRSGSRSSDERSWVKQLRELAKASFTKEGSGTSNDPSTSQGRWSGFWNVKKSGSPSMTSSSDFKSKPRGLYKDLEAIFASK